MEWNNKSFVITAVIFTSVLFLLLIFGFTTPLPLPAEQGILINFGDDDSGFGSEEPKPVEKVIKQVEVSQANPPSKSEDQALMTQDFEDAPAVAAEKTSTPTKKTDTKTETEKVVKEEPKPVVDTRALWGKNKNSESTSSEGTSSGVGNQGSSAGDVNATSHSLGTGSGDGISFSLNGRSAVKLPTPEFNHQKEGTVVVQITVDRSGKVTSAVPGVKGSTTLDSYLLEVAKRAALSSRFNSKEDAQTAIQQGTITYLFRLK